MWISLENVDGGNFDFMVEGLTATLRRSWKLKSIKILKEIDFWIENFWIFIEFMTVDTGVDWIWMNSEIGWVLDLKISWLLDQKVV